MKEFNLDVKQAMAEVLLGKTVEDSHRTRYHMQGTNLMMNPINDDTFVVGMENILRVNETCKFRVFLPDLKEDKKFESIYCTILEYIKEAYTIGYKGGVINISSHSLECAGDVLEKLQELEEK